MFQRQDQAIKIKVMERSELWTNLEEPLSWMLMTQVVKVKALDFQNQMKTGQPG